jgi:hypothetical protein
MLRPIFTILSALSLVLCVATGAMWTRSYWVHDKLGWSGDVHQVIMQSAMGRISIKMARKGNGLLLPEASGFTYISGASDRYSINDWTGRQKSWQMAGVIWHERINVLYGEFGLVSFRLVVIPYWLIGALTVPLPAIWCRQRLKRRLHRTINHCRICG